MPLRNLYLPVVGNEPPDLFPHPILDDHEVATLLEGDQPRAGDVPCAALPLCKWHERIVSGMYHERRYGDVLKRKRFNLR